MPIVRTTSSLFVVISLLCSQLAHGLCVSSAQANLRGGPGSKYPITWKVQRHMPLAEIRRQGPWIHVRDVDGVKHWVYKTLVSQNKQCLVIKSKFANLRKGPGRKYAKAKLPIADRYFAFEKVDSEAGWFQIRTGGMGTAWVHESLVWRALRVQRIGF